MSKPGWMYGVVENEIKKKSLYLCYNPPTPAQPPPKPERRKSSQLLPANPEAGTLSNAALPSIHQHWLPRRWWWWRGEASINSSQKDGASRERARGGDPAEDSPGSSLDHLIQGQLATSISRKGGDRLSYHHFFPRSSPGPSIIAFGRGRRKRTGTPGRGRPQGLRPLLPLCAQAVVRRGQHQLSPVRSEPLGPARPWGCCCHSCASAAKRGLGSAQLLIIPAQSSGDVSARSRTHSAPLPASEG